MKEGKSRVCEGNSCIPAQRMAKTAEEWNGNAASNDQFELEFILNVLETHSMTAYQLEEKAKNARKLESIR